MPLTHPDSKPPNLLDPEALARIGGLDLIARTVVEGIMSGQHRSTHRGGCCEFDEYRRYAQGDDMRLLDWRLFARTDRYYVKQFKDETNLHAWLLVDTSASMRFGESTMSKFDYARILAACLARLLLKQRDAIGLLTGAGRTRQVVPPRPRALHFQSIIEQLQSTRAEGGVPLAESVFELSPLLKRRSLVIVLSDCFGDLTPLTQGLHQLRLRGHDVLVFQTLAPEEFTFSFRDPALFEDLEGGTPRLNVHPATVRRRYLRLFEDFMQELQATMTDIDCDFITLSTQRNVGDSLEYFLRRRSAARRERSRS